MLSPSRNEYRKQAELGGSIPVYRDVLADMETPLSAYWKLAHDETHSFLLESVTGGENLARYSMIGVRPRLVVRSKGRSVRLNQRGNQSQQELEEGEDPLEFIRREIKPVRQELLGDLPKFCGGAVGCHPPVGGVAFHRALQVQAQPVRPQRLVQCGAGRTVDLEAAMAEAFERVDRFALYEALLLPLENVKESPKYHPEGDAVYHSHQVFERVDRVVLQQSQRPRVGLDPGPDVISLGDA
ncbi:MAG: hypothetical protein IIC73_04810 [Armatimonadetes bacterium]|nr:hypothetical protein [Armatimonadota bacterium]